MKLIKRDVDLVGAAVVAGNGFLPSETKDKIVMMGFFQEKAGHEVRYQYKKSSPPASHLCPYPER